MSYQEQSGDPNAFRPVLYFYDGLGRVVQTKAESQNGTEMIVTNVTYDARGLKEKEYVPYFVNDSGSFWNYVAPDTNQPGTSYTYDALGREEERTYPDDTQVRTDYDGWKTAVLDEKNHQTIYERDAYGRLVKIKEYTGTGPYTLYATTGYSYNGLDLLTGVTDAAGNATTIEYDPLGRKISMDDPDMGQWSYTYDAAGNLTRQTDARNQTICFYYDALNRLKGKTYRTDTNCPADPGYSGYTIKYYYDQTGHGSGVGRRTRMVDDSGSTDWTYDNRGRVTEETKVIGGPGGGTFRVRWSYDALDRVATMTYPGGNAGQLGEPVTFSYTAQALVDSVAGDSTYVQSSAYDALGRVTQRMLGSGNIQTTRVYYPWGQTNGRGRLQQLKAGPSSDPTSLQDLRYQYDGVGNVTRIEDWKAGNPEALNFGYDDPSAGSGQALDRLTSASGAYGESYSYDLIGNLTYKSDVGSYSYGSGRPHAVTVAGSNSYGYDANGNQTSRSVNGTGYSLTYDAEGRLTQVSGAASASFSYDADGTLVKRVAGQTTVYVTDRYQKNINTGEVTKYYYFGSRRVAARIAGTLYGLLTDHLSSTMVLVDGSGNVAGEKWYYPYGEERHSEGSLFTDRRFTGQRWDATIRLYDYRARYYDPALGRFVQPGSIVPEPGNPQDLNRCSYGRNNPLVYTDPTGHDPILVFPPLPDDFQVDISNWPRLAKDLAVVGCHVVGCHVDPERTVITPPTGPEAIESAMFDLVNPIGMVEGRAAKVVKEGMEEVAERIARIDPSKVRFTQDSISYRFRRPYQTQTIDDLAEMLKSGQISPEDLPPIRVVEKDGLLLTLDNRRLEAFRRASIDIPYAIVDLSDPKIAAEFARKFTTKDEGLTIIVRGEP